MTLLRPIFDAEGVASCMALRAMKGGDRVRIAGVVLVRQRPGKGNAIFITLEDEGGIANIVLWARQFERFRREVMAARVMLVEGEVQRSPQGVIHVMASRIVDRSEVLGALTGAQLPTVLPDAVILPRASGHPRNVRLLPKSRDFH